jgi:predicted NAD/FAD-binding protein
MKVAIIGGGISGNTVAYQLCKEHDITLYESGNHLGGHTHTHEIDWQGSSFAIDTGFIVFNDRTYPHFMHLLKELGVEKQATEMSFSVMNSDTGLEYNGHSLDTLFAQRSNIVNPTFHRMLWDIIRFNRQSRLLLQSDKSDISLGEYLYSNRYHREFIENYIVPMGAAIWSTDPGSMYDFPAKFFIRFFENHGLLSIKNRPQWYVIKGGSKQYVKAMSENYAGRVKLNTPIEEIQRTPTGVLLKAQGQPGVMYDAVFFACHSDQALKILGNTATELERQTLSAIRYQENEAVLHTDIKLLPSNRRAWASWNYNVSASGKQGAAVTYHMNTLQGLQSQDQFCVTLNASELIDKKKVIKKMVYHHPMFTLDALQAQQNFKAINQGSTYFCGAYWRNGFHEDGVVSALNAVNRFNHHFNQQFKEQADEKLHFQRAS